MIDAALERHDPPVQDFGGRRALTAEVVDDEHAAVGERLERRAVETAAREITEFQGIECQFAADGDDRATATDPAVVSRRFVLERAHVIGLDFLVVHRVVARG